MTGSVTYRVEVGVDDDLDEEELDEQLQNILLDLYDDSSVQSIRVTKDGYTTTDEDVVQLTDILGEIRSKDIKNAIDMVKKLESMEGDDE